MKHASVLLGCLLGTLPAANVRAFSEPLLYGEDPLNGGGGGRYFTGSPLDAYSCAVCHEGGQAPSVRLSGFPQSFQPGKTYDIAVTWTRPTSPHGLNLEIVDVDGRAAGKLVLPDAEAVVDDDRCIFTDDESLKGTEASYQADSGERSIVGVRACGARSLHFQFVAPNLAKVALTAAVVRSDESEDTQGDGVYELRMVSYRNGEPVAQVRSAGCALSDSGRSSAPWSVLLSVLLFPFARTFLRRSVARRS